MKKIINVDQVPQLVEQLRDDAKTIVLAGGCFDILHQGHLEFLKAAKKQGDILIVALENDENVKRLKGQDRPINKQNIRASNLLKTGLVDYVVVLPTLKTATDYSNLIRVISPNIIAITKGDPKIRNKRRQAEIIGAKVKEVIERISSHSTTNIINNQISK